MCVKINNLSQNNAVINSVRVCAVYADGIKEEICAPVIDEHSMQLYVNEQEIMEITCTKSNLAELVTGRMLTEGIIENADEIDSIHICEKGLRANVFLNRELVFEKKLYKEATCCTMNRTLLNRANEVVMKKLPDYAWDKEWIFNLANVFAADSKIHKATKGTHSCYLSRNGEVIISFEDIGRHNAMDKAIGYALINGIPLNECILYTTGRVPTDMVKKAIMAGVPVLVSKAVPTDAAIKMAKEHNLTLICKAWPDKFEIFAK
jgi:FdhD protein